MLDNNVLKRTVILAVFLTVTLSEISEPFFNISSIEWIKAQAKLCPYISLCTLPNSSVYDKPTFNTGIVPCCRQCSCDKGCEEEQDTCCPDFISHGYNRSAASNDFLKPPTPTEAVHTDATVLDCVRTHHGLILNNNGYEMVSLCPSNYTDSAIKYLCEEKLDFLTADFYDHIPLSDKQTGLTFKNRFCKLCNLGYNELNEFWEVWFHCLGRLIFTDIQLKAPLEYVKQVLEKQSRTCNIVFKPRKLSKASNTTKPCKREEIIDTCDDERADADAISACKAYTWPVSAKTRRKFSTYKNYACMRCNGVDFKDYCDYYVSDGITGFELSLTLEIPELEQSATELQKETNEFAFTNGTQIIQQVFTKGNECSDGFIYFNRKDVCRQVYCPTFFFVKDGKCVPMFGVTKGVFYRVLFDILLPHSLNGAPTDDVETSIYSCLDGIFRKWVGMGNYEFSLWSNLNSTKEINVNVEYVVLFTFGGKYYEVNYSALLKLISRLVLYDRHFQVSAFIANVKRNVNVGIRFTKSFSRIHSVLHRYRLKDTLKYESLHVVKPIGWKLSGDNEMWGIDITELSFCYVVWLYENEYEWLLSNKFAIRVLETKGILFGKDFRKLSRDYLGDVSVCIHDAYNDVAGRSSYAMNSSDTLDSSYSWPSLSKNQKTGNKDRSDTAVSEAKTREKSGVEASAKSLVAIISTLGVALAIISVHSILKRFIKYQNDNLVDGEGEVIPMSDIVQRS